LHHLQVITDNWSNICLNSLEVSPTFRWGNFASRNSKHPSVILCEVYFDTLNHLGMTHECDSQKWWLYDSKCRTSLRSVAKNTFLWNKVRRCVCIKMHIWH